MGFLSLLYISLNIFLILTLLTSTTVFQSSRAQTYDKTQVKISDVNTPFVCDGTIIVVNNIDDCPVRCYTGDFDDLFVKTDIECDVTVNNVGDEIKFWLCAPGVVVDDVSDCPVKCPTSIFFNYYVWSPDNCSGNFINNISQFGVNNTKYNDSNTLQNEFYSDERIVGQVIPEPSYVVSKYKTENNNSGEVLQNLNASCYNLDCSNKNSDIISDLPFFNFFP